MQSRTIMQAVLFLVILAAMAYVVVKVSTGWADYVVLAVIIITVLGAARAVYTRRYPTKKRTFVRHSGPGPGTGA